MTSESGTPFFLEVNSRRLFVLLFTPAQETAKRGVILHIPAFAEEMNKSRAMVTAQARAMAAQGFTVLVPDYFGTGDSQGDFSEASWQIWLEDMHACQQWLLERYGQELMLWGLRLGALMALELASKGVVSKLILWNPVLQGEQFMLQFLRLRLANSMIYGDNKEKLADLKLILEQEGDLEVAGYQLSSALFAQTCKVNAKTFDLASVDNVLWTDVSINEKPLPTPAQNLVAQYQASGVTVDIRSVVGNQFWNTQEITRADTLVEITTDWLSTQFQSHTKANVI